MKQPIKTLWIGLILVAISCGSFYFFYKKAQKNRPKQDLILTSAVINQPLPTSSLVSISGERLEDEKLRRGKIVLVFMMPDCSFCDQENEFLKTVTYNRKDVVFYYIVPFGNKEPVLKLAQSKYAFSPFYDNGSNLSRKLELYQVPVKVFLENGIIKKVWLDATISARKQAEFKEWLNGL